MDAPERRQRYSPIDKKMYSPKELEALFDVSDCRSIPNLLPPYVGKRIVAAYRKKPELFVKNEDELVEMLPFAQRPKIADRRLRLSFWEEYNRVASLQDQAPERIQKPINVENIIRGVCHRTWFLDRFLGSPEKVAFMVCPPASYLKSMEEALTFGIDSVRRFLELPEYRLIRNKKTGLETKILNVRLLELKTKIAFALAQQMKGSVIKHQVESRSMHLVGVMGAENRQFAPMKHIQNRIEDLTMEELDKKIQELEILAQKKARDIVNLPADTEFETLETPDETTAMKDAIDDENDEKSGKRG